jgi:hypothetical protein
MPLKDGTGPPQGGGRGGGGGRMGGPYAAGPGGECVCSKYGRKTAHIAGQPCHQQKCPDCGANMTRG